MIGLPTGARFSHAIWTLFREVRHSVDWKTTTTLLAELNDPRSDAAWDGFLHRFRVPVSSFLRGQGIPEADLEDVAQDVLVTFVELYRGNRYDRERGRLSSWLFGIAHKLVLRQRARRRRLDEKIEATEGAEASPEDSASWDLWSRYWNEFLLRESLRRARDEFSPQTFAAFELTALKGEEAERTAQELGIDVKAVYNARHRVLSRMRQLRLEIEGEDTAS